MNYRPARAYGCIRSYGAEPQLRGSLPPILVSRRMPQCAGVRGSAIGRDDAVQHATVVIRAARLIKVVTIVCYLSSLS
jgi:hypothetical protein